MSGSVFTETHTATATTTDNFGMQIRGITQVRTSDILIYGMQLESAEATLPHISLPMGQVKRGLLTTNTLRIHLFLIGTRQLSF